jgi:hypothetical protein
MLSCLADDSWRQLDLAGCSKLYGTELLAAAAKMPQLTALDVTGGRSMLAQRLRTRRQQQQQQQV